MSSRVSYTKISQLSNNPAQKTWNTCLSHWNLPLFNSSPPPKKKKKKKKVYSLTLDLTLFLTIQNGTRHKKHLHPIFPVARLKYILLEQYLTQFPHLIKRLQPKKVNWVLLRVHKNYLSPVAKSLYYFFLGRGDGESKNELLLLLFLLLTEEE